MSELSHATTIYNASPTFKTTEKCENGNQEWGGKDETHETDVQVTCTAEWNGSYKNQAIDIKSQWPTVLTFVNCVDSHSRLSKIFSSTNKITLFSQIACYSKLTGSYSETFQT